MASHIGQRFLDDAIGRYLHGCWQSGQVLWCFDRHAQTPIRLTARPRQIILCGILPDRSDEAQFIQRRWTQGIDQPTDIGDG